jgi:prephenate dehydrogenase
MTGRTPLPNAVCVIGLGLIGGSLMRAAAPHLPVFGWSPADATRAAAAGAGYAVEPTLETALTRAVAEDALVVLAAPVTEFGHLLRALDEHAPAAALTDVGGVKGPIASQVATLAPRARYIGSHPMTGSERSGWAAGSGRLFTDTAWVTTLDEVSDIAAWADVAGLAVTLGARVVPCEADAHDDAAARISHLPHLMAAALAQVGATGGPLALSLAAGSFADGTRVAASRPELTRAMCEGNPVHVTEAMDEVLAQLGVARGSLASSGSLAMIARRGFEARAALDARFADLQPVTLAGGDMTRRLLAIGAAGGFVTGVTHDGSLTVRAKYPRHD